MITQRTHSNRRLTITLGILVVGPCLFYVWMVMRTAEEMRMRRALDRNLTTARLSARLLDEQCNSALTALRLLARRYQLATSLRFQNLGALHSDIANMVELVPDLSFVAIYKPDGRIVDSYPRTFTARTNATKSNWWRGIHTTKSLYISDVIPLSETPRTQAIALVIPLGDSARPLGYLLAYYKLGEIHDWLRGFGLQSNVRTHIVTMQGQMIAASGIPTATTLPFPIPPLRQRVSKEPQGTLLLPDRENGQELLVGYALVSRPQWIVTTSQSKRYALDVTDYLFLRLGLLYIPMLAIMLFTARALIRQYRQQDSLAQQLRDRNAALVAEDKTKSDFLANISHDLWTPLAGLQVSISGLLDPKIQWSREIIRECLELASDELDRLIARVRNLLEMARLESHAHLAPKEPCDLEDIVGSALERLAPLLKGRQVYADFPTFPAVPLMFEGRYGQFEIVIMNLLENAIKYSPPGSALAMRGERRENDILFFLRDVGPGVPPGEERRIFDKFYRAEKFHPQGGTGLGLAICKGIIEEHGGVIGVMNPPGGGAEFWFSVPALSSQGR